MFVGVSLRPQYSDWDSMRAAAIAVDELGFDWLLTSDHLVASGDHQPDPDGPIFEAWQLVAAWAAITKQVRIGVMVSAVVTAGFSQGAGLAVVLATRRRLPGVVGFIGVAPSAGWTLDLLGSEAIDGRGLRGHLMVGNQDPLRDACERLAQRLGEAGVEVHAEVIEGLGHHYPPDFEDRLPAVLDWVIQARSEGASA